MQVILCLNNVTDLNSDEMLATNNAYEWDDTVRCHKWKWF